MDRDTIKLLACEQELVWLRDPHGTGYAYIRQQFFPMVGRNKLGPYTCWAGCEVIGWMRPHWDALKHLDPKQKRVRVFFLYHGLSDRIDGFDRWIDDKQGGTQVSLSHLSPGRPAVAPVGAHAVTAAQRVAAIRCREAAREYWLSWQRGQTPAKAQSESKPVQVAPKTGILGWLMGKGKK